MAHTGQRLVRTTNTTTRVCPACQHRLITVVNDLGAVFELDTMLPCHVITGRTGADGLPIYAQSRSYVAHAAVCKG